MMIKRSWLHAIPAGLIGLRFALGPVVYGLAAVGAGALPMALATTAGFLSDVLDGVVARRLGVATAGLREADSWVDTWYYLWVAAAAWRAAPDLVAAWAWPLAGLLGWQAFQMVVDGVKYRRVSSYHAYLAKAWGVSLYAAAVALLAFHTAGAWLWLAIALGVASIAENIAITLILPRWTNDVKGIWLAPALRREQVAERAKGAE